MIPFSMIKSFTIWSLAVVNDYNRIPLDRRYGCRITLGRRGEWEETGAFGVVPGVGFSSLAFPAVNFCSFMSH